MPGPSLIRFAQILLAIATLPVSIHAQTTESGTPPPGPLTDTSVVDANGTAHITRIIPLPATLSDEAKARWSRPTSDAVKPSTLAQRRAGTDTWQTGAGKKSAAIYPVKITQGQTIASVPVRIIDPLPNAPIGPNSGVGSSCDPLHFSAIQNSSVPAAKGPCKPESSAIHSDRVLICLHGGGFNSDSGSYTESIPIANLTRSRVVSVLYRLAPEHPYPAAVEDTVAVYRELLKTYKPAHIAIYGTSAGALLTAEVAVRLKQLALPQPAALGIFSGMGDLTAVGDSAALYALAGYSGHLDVPEANPDHQSISPEYTTTHDAHDPVLSPNYSDLHGLPPTLFITSGRDVLLSATANMQRAWARDAVSNELIMFDGLPHAFWNDVSIPESREAYAIMARFFLKQLQAPGE